MIVIMKLTMLTVQMMAKIVMVQVGSMMITTMMEDMDVSDSAYEEWHAGEGVLMIAMVMLVLDTLF